ncbi:MAG: hypothetical protein KGL61_17505, partial [Burkholderiales bacterium]|nr:hypothetical protein [Burkholderiales bacterium]
AIKMKTTQTLIAAIVLCAAGVVPAMAKDNHPCPTMPAWISQMWQGQHAAAQTGTPAPAAVNGQSLPAGERHRP